VCACVFQDTPHQIQAITPAMQRELRFMAKFSRQGAHHRCSDIGRVAQYQVVTFAGKGGEQVRAMQLHSGCQLVVAQVAAGNRQRGAGNVCAINLRAREGVSGDNGQAAGTRTQVKNGAGRLTQPGLHAAAQQFSDIGTRHDNALINVEAVFTQPGLACQVGGRQAFRDAPLEQLPGTSGNPC